MIDLLGHHVVAYVSQNLKTIVESDIKQAEMLSLIPKDVDTKFINRYVDARDISTINKHFAEQR